MSANKRSADESVHNLSKDIQGSNTKRQKLEEKSSNMDADSEDQRSDGGDQNSKAKWKTLEHHGMTFP